MTNLNDKAVLIDAAKFIIPFEGFKATPYQCSARRWTIGYGTTRYPNGTYVQGTDAAISETLAFEMLIFALEGMVPALEKFRLQLTENQVIALMSFVYNLGELPLGQSKSMGKALLMRDHQAVADAFLLYDKYTDPATGAKKPLPGLTRRRLEERKKWNTIPRWKP